MSDILWLSFVLLVLSLLFRIDFVYYIVYVCAGILILSRFVSPRMLKRLKVHRSFIDHAFLGELVAVTLTISNESILPIPWVQVAESNAPNLAIGRAVRHAFPLGGKGSRAIEYEVKPMRRGFYRLGPLLFTIGDLFGFAEKQARFGPGFLTVYPQIIPLTGITLDSRMPFGTIPSKQRLFEDPIRPIGVRRYRAGDSLRIINWKVSAHAEELLVNTFEPAISLETAIVLNLNQTSYSHRFKHDGPEWAIVVAATLAAHLVSRRQSVGLATNGLDPLLQKAGSEDDALEFDTDSGRLTIRNTDRRTNDSEHLRRPLSQSIPPPIPPRPGRTHLIKVLEQLARIESAETVPFHTWLPASCHNLSWGNTILVITPDADERLCRSIHQLLRSGYSPLLIIVDPFIGFGEIRRRAVQLGFPAFRVINEKDLRTRFGGPINSYKVARPV
jgi:uncharacterized protein (DUF58 family)